MKNSILIFVLIFVPFSLFANADIDKIRWYTEEYPPYNYTNDKKEVEGIAIELLEATLIEAGSKTRRGNFVVAPWARGYRNAQKEDTHNAIFSTTRTEERENLFKWFGPIGKTVVSIIGHKTGITLEKEDLPNYKYAVIRDDIGELSLKSAGVADEKLSKLSEVAQLLKMIHNRGKGKKKKLDFMAYEWNVANFIAKKEGFDISEYTQVYKLKEGELWYAVNKTVSDETVKKLQEALDKVKKDKKVIEVLKEKFNFDFSKD